MTPPAPLSDRIEKCIAWAKDTRSYFRNYPNSDLVKYDECEEVLRESLAAVRSQEWIPCAERLPENGDIYLVSYAGRKETDVREFSNDRWDDLFGDSVEDLRSKIIAWMPLPPAWGGER